MEQSEILKKKIDGLRDLINSSICYKQGAWDKKDNGNWNKLWSGFDNVEDTKMAIDEYLSFAQDSRLAVYGVLQALVVQQDAVLHIEEAVEISKPDFNKYPNMGEIRRVRNETIGHPTETKTEHADSLYKEGTITYTSIDPRSSSNLEYTVWSKDGPSRKKINLKEAILEQQNELSKEFDRIIEKIKKDEANHKEKFKGKSLESVLNQSGYLIGVLWPHEHNRFHSKFCFESLLKIYEDFQKGIKDRYKIKNLTEHGVQIPGLIEEIKHLEKILPRIEKMVPMDNPIDEVDMEVYIESLKNSFSSLEGMAKEIDKDFNS
jgi:hypothetical protein